jgi:hypothetical protein
MGRYIGMVMIPEIVRQALLRPGLKANGGIHAFASNMADWVTGRIYVPVLIMVA